MTDSQQVATQGAQEQQKPRPLMSVFRDDVHAMEAQWSAALPAHMPVERFMRVVISAVQNNSRLVTHCDRKSLFSAAMKCAQDGLLPDGREAALVEYGGTVTYVPMVYGVRKRARNSGEISAWDVYAVHENDQFEFMLGDTPRIHHVPNLKEPGDLKAVYSVATLKDGTISREVMSVAEVKRIRDRSVAFKLFKSGKIKSTPWDSDFEEMAKKTVAKRHSKVLPMSSDLDDLIRRDDDLYDFDKRGEQQQQPLPATGSLADRMAALVGDDPSDEASGPTIEGTATSATDANSEAHAGDDDQGGNDAGEQSAADPAPNAGQRGASETAQQSAPADPLEAIRREGAVAREKGMSRKAVPPKYRNNPDQANAWLEGFDGGAQ